ncbi:hypothetical protein DFH09DRAFT_1110393 [Mycena vulgaris]|nr:hypothetical protein DFH09DRAFT_1110393 [Mycena vulgaris]
MPVSLYPEDMMLQRGVLVLGMHPIMFYAGNNLTVICRRVNVVPACPHSPVPLEVWEGMTRVQVELPLPLPLLYLWVYFWRYTLTPGDPYRRLLVRKLWLLYVIRIGTLQGRVQNIISVHTSWAAGRNYI